MPDTRLKKTRGIAAISSSRMNKSPNGLKLPACSPNTMPMNTPNTVHANIFALNDQHLYCEYHPIAADDPVLAT